MDRFETRIPQQRCPVNQEPRRVGRRMYVGSAGLYLQFAAPFFRAAGDIRVIDLASTTGRGGGDDAA